MFVINIAVCSVPILQKNSKISIRLEKILEIDTGAFLVIFSKEKLIFTHLKKYFLSGRGSKTTLNSLFLILLILLFT